MPTKDVIFPAMKHDVMVGRAKTVTSKLIDAHTEMKLLLDDLVVSEGAAQIVPVILPPATGNHGGIAKLLLAFIACLAIGATAPNYTREAAAMSVKFPNRFENGFKLMKERNWTQAAAEFASVSEDGGRDYPEAMAREAECLFMKREYTLAVRAANDLEAVQKSHPAAPYIRGLVFESQGKKERAAEQYQLAEFLGHPLAGERLATVEK